MNTQQTKNANEHTSQHKTIMSHGQYTKQYDIIKTQNTKNILPKQQQQQQTHNTRKKNKTHTNTQNEHKP